MGLQYIVQRNFGIYDVEKKIEDEITIAIKNKLGTQDTPWNLYVQGG